jgi:hypothetical protein
MARESSFLHQFDSTDASETSATTNSTSRMAVAMRSISESPVLHEATSTRRLVSTSHNACARRTCARWGWGQRIQPVASPVPSWPATPRRSERRGSLRRISLHGA